MIRIVIVSSLFWGSPVFGGIPGKLNGRKMSQALVTLASLVKRVEIIHQACSKSCYCRRMDGQNS